MFFLIRYQTVVASRRLINFARQLCSRVTLVRMMASSFARHFLQAGVFIICCAAKFPRGIKIIRCQVGVLEEKKISPSGLRVVPTLTLALARANASGPSLGFMMVAGCFNCRRFLDESLPPYTTRGRPIRGKMAKAFVHRTKFLLCTSEARENFVAQRYLVRLGTVLDPEGLPRENGPT